MNGQHLAVGVLAVLVLGSALATVYCKHRTRVLFVQLQGLHEAQDQANTQWGQLQLEQSTWATHGRIERLARKELQMRIPDPDHIVIIRP